ncbi:protein translocase subunit SecD [Mobilicoccus caccae]|uniref:Protein translocase subunit SecD n=1 Tax=Mobilicoccus caccae TaxID=1859295 RepID=A0ABQ6IP33_9MICO|nr:protein translocase subunit SecD [Mobilicoccus caccae]GMA39654.1 hypothetical protein GCM10025883_16990 [Mobilicoccus caccae]
MAKVNTRSAWRSLAAMAAILLALAIAVGSAVQWGGGQPTPKLGLDLEGGTQMVLAPQVGEGQSVNEQQLAQAVDIIRARVDGQGVAEAEVATLGSNVVVAVPGEMNREQEEALRQSSQMRFRPVLAVLPAQQAPAPTPGVTGEPTEAPTGDATETVAPTGSPSPAATPTGSPTASGTPAEPAPTTTADVVAPQALTRAGAPAVDATPSPTPTSTESPAASEPAAEPTTPASDPTALLHQPKLEEVAPGLTRITAADRQDPQKLIEYATNEAWMSVPQYIEQIQALDCTKPQESDSAVDPDLATVACDTSGAAKYLLGPSVIDGDQLADASAGPRTNNQGQPMPGYQVNLRMKGEAVEPYRIISTYMLGLQEPRNQLATVLDGRVVSAPYFQGPIPDGQAAISGDFDNDGAQALADQLKFGALPMSFTVQSSEQISPTVGADQLQLGIIAGLIGLGLVIVYFFVQYRVLGIVTTASLLLVALVTYLLLTLLGWHYNLRLTMAGVTGAIVAIGTTADSFIVYFERVRDEVRDGRAVGSAVLTGWGRARRTILISGAVNFLAALVLYILAASNVRGFAFMLMLTTIIDLLVTFLFTFPMLTVLTRTTFFGEGHPMSGLSAESLGVDRSRYLGRGRFGRPGQRNGSTTAGGSGVGEADADADQVGSTPRRDA